MVQPGSRSDLAHGSARDQVSRRLRVKHLERHRTIVPEVVGQIDRSHPAPAKLALEVVAIG